jgi:hypothetical protein
VATLRRRWEREGNTRAYRLKLANKLLFKGADYQYFRAIYDTGTCTEVTLLIENYCGGEWVTWYEGIIPIFTGDYNASRCEVRFEVKPNDVYFCAQRAFEDRKNWLDYAEPVTVKTITGTVETITCSQSGVSSPGPPFPGPGQPLTMWFYKGCWSSGYTNSSDPDGATAWRPIMHMQHYYLGGTVDIETTWAREKTTSVGAPLGDGWINISGTTWVRPVNVSVPVITQPLPGQLGLLEQRFEATIVNSAPVSGGRKLAEIITELVAEMDCGFDEVISNFFGINADATNPSNDAYDFAADNMQNVFFFQKSDIVRASASNDATRFTFSLKEFWEELKILNIFYSITVESGLKKLRIEHYTYWDGANGLDLTTLENGKYIAGKDSFKVDREIPNFESFSYQESFRDKFRTKRITYPAACATTEGDERTANQMCADFGGLVENPDAGLEGFFLMATVDIGGGEYLINTLGGEANGAFAWENILPALWADGRYHADATANVTGYTVNSVAKTREQDQITIKFCCSDEFDPTELINTQLGWGEVKSAEQDTQRGTLKLNLLQ